MIKILRLCIFGLILFLLTPQPAFAVFNFSLDKLTITDTEEFTVSVNLDLSSSTANNSYFLRGAYYKEGTTQYFGYTKNTDGNYYNGPYGSCQNLYKITVDGEGNWSGEVKVKVDPQSSYFEGSGEYLFKIGRYTENCNITWADTEPIKVSITQTVFPSPSPSPSPLPTPQSTTKSPSPTPKASASPPSTPPKSPSLAPKTASLVLAEKDQSIETSQSLQATPSPSLSKTPSTSPDNSPSKFKVAGILSGTGLALIGVSFVLYLWYSKRLAKNENP